MIAEEAIELLREKQLAFFQSGESRELKWRKNALKRLKRLITQHESALSNALQLDLHRSAFDTYVAEIGPCLQEIDQLLRKLDSWSGPQKLTTPQHIHFWSKARVVPEPIGRVLIIAPWNYPYYLLFPPLAGALAAGCPVVLKPSEHLPHTSALCSELIQQTFHEKEVALLQGDANFTQQLLNRPWDHIFFTGSTTVGKAVMAAAAPHLSPVTLELGGKCPAIVDQKANIAIAARRIAWGKLLNAGQTCVAPDHVWVHEEVYDDFVGLLKKALRQQYHALGDEYTHLIHDAAFERMERLAHHAEAWQVAPPRREERHFPPVVLELENTSHASMQEEIFGPLLPILPWSEAGQWPAFTTHLQAPLAVYYFGPKGKRWKRLQQESRSGAIVRNEVVMHLAHPELPFGGVGESGIGRYHGRHTLDCFTQQRAVMEKITWFDPPVRYAPYKGKLKWMKALFRLP